MNATVSLLLGVHAHQPVGNFPAVIEEAHVRCYRPFLQTLHRFPDFRFSVHFSGWLLEQLAERFPADIALLREMVDRGQVELFGGGDCEPVLAAIPARDRLGQLIALADRLQHRFGQRPQGAWLTERVWEATVVPALADSGIGYVTVDDYHFLCTGKQAKALDGYYSTEEDGRRLDLFPISEALRYRLPFAPAHEAVAYLEQMAADGGLAAVYFDDIEKFGIWPETYDWVYTRGWLEQFIRGVLASKAIRTERYADFRASHGSRGVVYLPTTSYSEMNEWTLPAEAAGRYDDLLHRERDAGTLEAHRPFLRGGIWRNFFSLYPESNWMHKRMLALSERLAGHPSVADHGHLRESLYRAQANDAYWHGLFGGLYLPHLRRSVWNDLLRLESALNRDAPLPDVEQVDLDLDGCDELFLRSSAILAVGRLDGFAAIHELSDWGLAHNFADTLRRHAEQYHRKLDTAPAVRASGEGIASAHDRIEFKHEITPADALPDASPRALFVDFVDGLPLDTYAAAPGTGFVATGPGWQVDKRLAVSGRQLSVSYRFSGQPPARFSCQLNVAMPSCDGYSGRYILADGSIPCGFGQELTLGAANRLTLDDRELRGGLLMTASQALHIEGAPHHTVSQSEAGFEKIMQAACLSLSWSPRAGEEVRITLEVLADA